MTGDGLGAKLLRVYAIQVTLISAAMLGGIYITNTIVQDSLVRRALEGEAAHFWSLWAADRGQALPDTSNMRGYMATAGDFADVPQAFRDLPPGRHGISWNGGKRVVHVSERGERRLFLVFASDQVSNLAFYFGIVPLSIALVVIYGLSFLAYRLSRRAISPIVRLAAYLEGFDFDRDRIPELALDPFKGSGDAEVVAMIDAVERFYSRLAAFIERERVFTRDASHELRTPIAVFKGSLDLLDRKATTDAVDAGTADALRRMRRTVEDMEGLIETLLLLARGEEQALPNEPINVNPLIAGYVERLQPIAEKSGNTLRLSDTAELRLRVPERVLQILVTNLVRNAINYTRAGTVDVTIDSRSLTVADTGVGMGAEDLENAFEPFYRAENGRSMSAGHGLGLSIVRRLASQFQWEITARSEPNEGTSVEVKFASAF